MPDIPNSITTKYIMYTAAEKLTHNTSKLAELKKRHKNSH